MCFPSKMKGQEEKKKKRRRKLQFNGLTLSQDSPPVRRSPLLCLWRVSGLDLFQIKVDFKEKEPVQSFNFN